jgi:hypothetical protein
MGRLRPLVELARCRRQYAPARRLACPVRPPAAARVESIRTSAAFVSAKDRLKLACRDAIVVALIQKRFEAEKPAIDAHMADSARRAAERRDAMKACKTNAQFMALLRR